LNKANELLKKGLGVDLQLLSNREKTLLIDALREHYGLPDTAQKGHVNRGLRTTPNRGKVNAAYPPDLYLCLPITHPKKCELNCPTVSIDTRVGFDVHKAL